MNLIESRVLGGSGGRIAVALWDASLSVPAAASYATGQRLSLVLRPESLSLVTDSTKAGDGEVIVPGVVRSRTFLGEKVEYAVEVNGALLQIVSYDPTRRGVVEVGTRVGVACDAAAVRILEAEP